MHLQMGGLRHQQASFPPHFRSPNPACPQPLPTGSEQGGERGRLLLTHCGRVGAHVTVCAMESRRLGSVLPGRGCLSLGAALEL